MATLRINQLSSNASRWIFTPLVSNQQHYLLKKSLLIPLLLYMLLLIHDHHDNEDPQEEESEKHWMVPFVITALRAHPPSLRVFRGLSEFALLLFCSAFSFKVWEGVFSKEKDRDVDGEMEKPMISRNSRSSGSTSSNREHFHDKLGRNAIGDLLFQPAVPLQEEEERVLTECYNSDDDDEEDDEEDNHISNSDKNKEGYIPPSAQSVAGAAVDLSNLILVFLICFTLSSRSVILSTRNIHSSIIHMNNNNSNNDTVEEMVNDMSQTLSAITAPAFPLLLFLLSTTMALYPYNNNNKRSFWKVVMRTIEAPFHDVSFRDGFIGDILTSIVRPLQDTAYTLFYLLSGLQGWWSSLYTLDQASLPMERNYLLHNCVLPACMISPLWYRFLQNLRQCYVHKQRWPYLGNALKYLIAAEVALFGVYDPRNKQNLLWILAFLGATLYQVWWDTFMDWDLFRVEYSRDWNTESWIWSTSSEIQGTSSTSTGNSHSHWFVFPSIHLREKRLYSSVWIYYIIFAINILLRFCWTLSFIPARYLSKSGQLIETFSKEMDSFVLPMLAAAEIIRRTLWGLLRVELAALDLLEQQEQQDATTTKSGGSKERGIIPPSELELMPMPIGASGQEDSSSYQTTTKHGWVTQFFQSDMSNLTDKQILAELCVWGTVFTSLGIFAAAHGEG